MNKVKEDKKELYPIMLQDNILSRIYNFYKEKEKNRTSDAYSMYVFLYKNVRMQSNIRVWCDNTFIQKGLGLSAEKVRLVKKDLIEMELIELIRPRESNGQFSAKSFIEVKYVWKEKTVDKLFYKESDDTLKYKIAKKLLMHFEYIESRELYEIDINLNGKQDVLFTMLFHFEDNILKATADFSDGREFVFTVPTDRVHEIIMDLAKEQEYSFQDINEILQMKS